MRRAGAGDAAVEPRPPGAGGGKRRQVGRRGCIALRHNGGRLIPASAQDVDLARTGAAGLGAGLAGCVGAECHGGGPAADKGGFRRALASCKKKAGKNFFSEEKKQKTFPSWLCPTLRPWPRTWNPRRK
jgi:hypothetical protein